MNNATSPRNKNKTVQTVGTDLDFWNAIDLNFQFSWDLACTEENKLCENGLTEKENSLNSNWHGLRGWLWLNPPYKNIEPWAKKCYTESKKGANIVMLTPASVGTRWFEKWVHNKSSVKFLIGRLTFQGHKAPYPKDLMISIFNKAISPSYNIWDWKNKPYES